MSASVAPERSTEALFSQPEVITLPVARATGKIRVDFCPTRLRSVVSALPHRDCLNVGQCSARASAEVLVGTPRGREHGFKLEPQPKFESSFGQAGVSQ